jgi:ribonuclease BN (tRNA processing enzyme)
VATAKAAGVGDLILFHHHPEHSDDELDAIGELARAEFPAARVAREGVELEL